MFKDVWSATLLLTLLFTLMIALSIIDKLYLCILLSIAEYYQYLNSMILMFMMIPTYFFMKQMLAL